MTIRDKSNVQPVLTDLHTFLLEKNSARRIVSQGVALLTCAWFPSETLCEACKRMMMIELMKTIYLWLSSSHCIQ